jgi:hypothetical protein
MKKILFNIFIIFLALLAAGCTEDGVTPSKAFSDQSDISLMIDDNVVMTFNQDTDQLSFNRKRGMFRVGNDDMTEYFMLSAHEDSGFNLVEDLEFIGDLTYCTGGEVTKITDLTWTITAFDTDDYGTKVHLWCDDNKIGAVMYAVK